MPDGATTLISLRPLTLDDIDTIADLYIDFDDVALFDRNLPIPVGLEAVKESWKSATEYADPPRSFWFIAEDADKVPVGVCGLNAINYIHGDAILPVFIADTMRGKGLALAATIALIDLAFDRLRLHRVTTLYREDHSATMKILEKIGFQEEGRFREAWFADGIHRDVVQVSLLKSDWLSTRNAIKEMQAKDGDISINLRRQTISALKR